MASPKLEVFFLYDVNTGVPLTGAVGLTFFTYKDHTGANVTQPTIFEIGGGAYAFLPVFTPNFGIVYVVDAGPSATPQYVTRYMRPEDWNLDNADVPTSSISSSGEDFAFVRSLTEGNWQIHTSGPDINRMVIRKHDTDEVLAKYDLTDRNGLPTFVNPFKRTKVP